MEKVKLEAGDEKLEKRSKLNPPEGDITAFRPQSSSKDSLSHASGDEKNNNLAKISKSEYNEDDSDDDGEENE